ncbi:MAG TPA: CPBP family intramembrane glutamic endopeptidase [Thermoanaerobaculia bacterium]
MRERLERGEVRNLILWIALAAIAIAIVVRYYHSAFPEASIDFKYDREESRIVAERLLAARGIDVRGMKHAVRFDSDDSARIFLERSLGLDEASRALRGGVRAWYWHHRWFKPLQEEEVSVDVAPTGEVVALTHTIPEERAIPGAASPAVFLAQIGAPLGDLKLVEHSQRQLPRRMQHIFTFESKSIHPAGAPYRHTVTVDGGRVTGYAQRLKVPDAWQRSYRELREKNVAAGYVDIIFMIATMVAAVIVFIARLRRGDLQLRFLFAIGIACIVLVGLNALNTLPAQLAFYDTTTSYPAFLGSFAFNAAMQSVGNAMLLIVICGAGEVLYRERHARQLAIPRLWTPRALASKRVFLSLALGYALVPLFIAYQVVFYIVAQKFGAWAPAEVNYDEMLSSALPWAAVLFAGFFPALSEEFLSRAFSIPFLQRLVRSRLFAIVLAGFIWGFGHSTYPNQPFYIRGVEVGFAGIAAGLLFDRFGLLPLLVWHYTIDAVYTATLLFGSGKAYYVASAAVASLLFMIPLLASIALYVRNKGFIPDDDLTNATLPLHPPPPKAEVVEAAIELPDVPLLTRNRLLLCAALVVAAIVALALRPASPSDAIDYSITKEEAKDIARGLVPPRVRAARTIATPVEGFRSWNPQSEREDGGGLGDFDAIAATYLVQHGMSVDRLVGVFRTRVEAATWIVRFFRPLEKEEWFVEVDPRTRRAIGHHKYQDEANAGPHLPQEVALALATRSFIAYGLDPRGFELKEALTFQQPARRDWLFHFEERTPLAAQAYRRVSVRVAGDEITQFNKHVKIPESVYREATTQTLLNIVLFVLKVIGAISLLALVIAGLVHVSRTHGLPWRRALRWTLPLAVLPLIAAVASREEMLFQYATTMTWETFRIRNATDIVRDFGLQLGLLFLAIGGILAALPYARALLTNEARRRFGRSAVVAALTTLAALVVADVAARAIAHALPSAAAVDFAVPTEVALPFPALVIFARAIFWSILVSGAVALYASALRRYAAAITIVALFCAMLDPLSTQAQAPLMMARAAVMALLAWLLARHVLGANPLAWPLVTFLAVIGDGASTLLQNHRADLLANGIGLTAIALAIVTALVVEPRRRLRA